jgi:macrolide transport system ATP-binding/permease protein
MGTGAWRARSRTHGAAGRIRQSRQRLRWLTDHPAPPPPEPLRFTATLAAETAPGTEVAALNGVVVEGRLRLDALTVRAGERLLITGPNGAGKTTLMRVLAGELRPEAGEVHRTGRVGYFRQDEPDIAGAPHRTVLQAYAHKRPGSPDDHADALLALGLFGPSDLGLRVGQLSYGQRRRIELARLVAEPVDLLLLDEPTNHLSPMLVEQLEEALTSYRGALVIVTHDRRLRATFTGTHLELNGDDIPSRAGRARSRAGHASHLG